jgi:GNAT superfamily N-acetyltransferase
LESYRAWAGPDWRPPTDLPGSDDLLRRRLTWPGAWAAVAEAQGEIRGAVAFKPMLAERWSGEPLPGIAHVWMLFVHPDWWGRGIGRALHELCVGEMRARGYRHARLWTPTAARPARALYERVGWRATGAGHAEELGLHLTSYELDLQRQDDRDESPP